MISDSIRADSTIWNRVNQIDSFYCRRPAAVRTLLNPVDGQGPQGWRGSTLMSEALTPLRVEVELHYRRECYHQYFVFVTPQSDRVAVIDNGVDGSVNSRCLV